MKTALAMLAVILLSGAAFATEAGHAVKPKAETGDLIDRLQPGHWFEVPDSHLRKVAFKWPKGVKHGWGVAAVMTAWSGGAYDSKRDRLIVWGGGHGDYGGNEIYTFDVKKLKWERITDPSLQTDPEAKLERTGVFADGLPRSCHTYDYIEYVPSIDRFCSFGVGATWPMAFGQNPETLVGWAFDFEKKKWEKKSRIPWRVHASAWDPVSGRVWVRSRFAAYVAEWDPAEDAWTVRSKRLKGGGNFLVVGIVDPIGRRFLAVGGKTILAYDIGSSGLLSQGQVNSTGPQDILDVRMGAGVEYDPVLDKLVCWHGGGDVYTLDLESHKWEKLAPATGNTVIPTQPPKAGTWGRWRYIPSKNAYIVVNAVSQNVYIHRLTRRVDQPIPKRFAEVLKKKDAALVKWVAGEVVKWPREKAEPVLKAALTAHKEPGGAEIAKILEEALKGPK